MGISTAPPSDGADVDVREHVVAPGDSLEVFGDVHDEQIADGYRDRKQQVVRGTAGRPVILRRV